MNGNYIIIMRGSTAIAGTTAQDIETSNNVIERSSPSSSTWREFIRGRSEWSVNVSYLLLSASNYSHTAGGITYASGGLRDVLNVGSTYTLVIRDRTGSNTVTGSAILVKAKQTYQRGSLVKGSFTFRGTGSLW